MAILLTHLRNLCALSELLFKNYPQTEFTQARILCKKETLVGNNFRPPPFWKKRALFPEKIAKTASQNRQKPRKSARPPQSFPAQCSPHGPSCGNANKNHSCRFVTTSSGSPLRPLLPSSPRPSYFLSPLGTAPSVRHFGGASPHRRFIPSPFPGPATLAPRSTSAIMRAFQLSHCFSLAVTHARRS